MQNSAAYASHPQPAAAAAHAAPVEEVPAVRRRIVVVEDVDIQREVLVEYLTRAGFDVDGAPDGRTLRRLCAENRYDLAIMDLQLPDEDGMELVRFLASKQECGIIVLTGNDDPTDRIVGLEVGADDFLVKPHPPRELLARARCVLRRMSPHAQHVVEIVAAPTMAVLGDWSMEDGSRALVTKAGARLDLTAAEYALLRELASHEGEILTRDHLMRAVFNRAWEYEDRSMDVLLSRLRQKIAPTGQGERIKSVRGKGYILEA